MDNVVFKISGCSLVAMTSKKETDPATLNNTNVISNNDLKFTKKYILDNLDLVTSFLNVIILKNNVDTLQVNNMDIAYLCCKMANKFPNIEEIIFKPDKELGYDSFLELLGSKNIKRINCYQLKEYLIERIDINTNIEITTREKTDHISDFMIINKMSTYSDIFYKREIILPDTIDRIEEIDIDNFFSINSKVKAIKIIKYSNKLLTDILEKIIRHREHDICIVINEEGNDINTIISSVTYLKKSFKKYFDNNNIKFKVNYSKEYKRKNFLKEINLKLFGTIIILAALVISGLFLYKSFNQHKDEDISREQHKELLNILNTNEYDSTQMENTIDMEYITDRMTDTNSSPIHYDTPSYLKAYKTNYSKVFDELKAINEDTVGWLRINNTSISYPVVQKDDNYYYLSHDFYNSENSMGWVFADYRNDLENLDQNTLIYGHNTKYGVIFGTMRKAFYSSWYNNQKNMLITFNTTHANMKWQIFSMYEVPETNDYLVTQFKDGNDFINFTNMLKARSIKDFGVEIGPEDKILTISTCHKHTTRQVIHAKLVEIEVTQ